MKSLKVTEENKKYMSLLMDIMLGNQKVNGAVSLIRVKNTNNDDDIKTMIVLQLDDLKGQLLPIGFVFDDLEESMNKQETYYPVSFDDDDSIEIMQLKQNVEVIQKNENNSGILKISKFGLN